MTDADEIAVEHIIWAAENGQSPRDVLASIGEPWKWGFEPSTGYVVGRLVRSLEWISREDGAWREAA
jgi:hypothetical protein